MSPGSVPTNATEIYQEGLRIPPLKLRDGGVFNDTLIAMLRQNVRMPDTVMGDLNAQVAACTVGARRLAELADGYGAQSAGLDLRRTAAPFGDDDARRRSRTSPRAPIATSTTSTMTASSSTSRSASRSPSRSKSGDIEFDFDRHQPAGARAVQLRAVRLAGGGVLRGARR